MTTQHDQSPIFVLASSWRSGSTLLQRMLFPEVFVWGEPYGEAHVVQSLARQWSCLRPKWPQPDFFRSSYREDESFGVSERFVANIYPELSSYRAAHRAFLQHWLVEPSQAEAPPRWGLKEVRFGVREARYLKEFFPDARFLLLHRNPIDAYRSYAGWQKRGITWYDRWPDRPLDATRFADHWARLTGDFLDCCDDVDGLLVRYDELRAGRFEAIESYLGFPVNREASQRRPSDRGGPPPADVIEKSAISALTQRCGALMERLGYEVTSLQPTTSQQTTRLDSTRAATGSASQSSPPTETEPPLEHAAR